MTNQNERSDHAAEADSDRPDFRLHIKAPGELAYGKVDTAAALTRCVAALNALTPRPDLVVISGDLVDTRALRNTRISNGYWRRCRFRSLPYRAITIPAT